MSDTVVDFGGFTVDVSKIQEIHEGPIEEPKMYTAISFYGDGVGRAVAFGFKTAPAIIAAYEKHNARVARENLADGWYWASSDYMKRKLIRVKAGMVSARSDYEGAPIGQTSWSTFEPADTLSDAFIYAMRIYNASPSAVNS